MNLLPILLPIFVSISSFAMTNSYLCKETDSNQEYKIRFRYPVMMQNPDPYTTQYLQIFKITNKGENKGTREYDSSRSDSADEIDVSQKYNGDVIVTAYYQDQISYQDEQNIDNDGESYGSYDSFVVLKLYLLADSKTEHKAILNLTGNFKVNLVCHELPYSDYNFKDMKLKN